MVVQANFPVKSYLSVFFYQDMPTAYFTEMITAAYYAFSGSWLEPL